MAGNSTESLAEKSVINEIVGRAIRDEALSWKVLWFAFCIRRDRRAVRLGDSIPDGRRTQPPVGQNHAHYWCHLWIRQQWRAGATGRTPGTAEIRV